MTKKSLKEFRAHWRKKLRTLDRLYVATLVDGEESAADEILATYRVVDSLISAFESAVSKERRRTYKRLKVVNSSGIISDLDGNLTLQCASPRGLRLLRRITKSQSLKAGFSAGSAIPEATK